MFSYIKNNIKVIIGIFSSTATMLLSLLTILLTFVSWEDMGFSEICSRLIILSCILALSAVFAVIAFLVKQSNDIWAQGTGKIRAIYGDIIRKAFPNRKSKERIVVIPVNTCFDTHVGDGLVSANTIHGKWILTLESKGIHKPELDAKINQAINTLRIMPSITYSQADKPLGKREQYPLGTVIPLDGKNGVTYFLLALSEFDQNLNAQCSKEDFIKCVQSLISFYDQYGQGNPIFLPLMGTGLSRVNISQEESLSLLINLLKLNHSKIHGEVNIVVYNKEKDKVSIHNI